MVKFQLVTSVFSCQAIAAGGGLAEPLPEKSKFNSCAKYFVYH